MQGHAFAQHSFEFFPASSHEPGAFPISCSEKIQHFSLNHVHAKACTELCIPDSGRTSQTRVPIWAQRHNHSTAPAVPKVVRSCKKCSILGSQGVRPEASRQKNPVLSWGSTKSPMCPCSRRDPPAARSGVPMPPGSECWDTVTSCAQRRWAGMLRLHIC